MAKRDDRALVTGLRRRDECALEEIDRRYGPRLRDHARRLLAGSGVDPDRRASRDTFDEAVEHERLRELPQRQARALVLHALEGRPQQEIAVELGTTARSVKGLVYRARRELAGRIESSHTS